VLNILDYARALDICVAADVMARSQKEIENQALVRKLISKFADAGWTVVLLSQTLQDFWYFGRLLDGFDQNYFE